MTCAMLGISIAMSLTFGNVEFVSAKPVWLEGRETEKNLFVGFRAVFDAPESSERVVLRVTASTLYRAFINGTFCGYGPARGPHRYYRVDEWVLSERLHPGRNLIAIEVGGYNVNSYYLLDQPSFLQAEVAIGGNVLASTAGMVHRSSPVFWRSAFRKSSDTVFSAHSPRCTDCRRATTGGGPTSQPALIRCAVRFCRRKSFCHVVCHTRAFLCANRCGTFPQVESSRALRSNPCGKTGRSPASVPSLEDFRKMSLR